MDNGLPAAPAPGEARSASIPDREALLKILMVDDEPAAGEAVGAALQGEPDVRFQFCQNPLAAVAAALACEPTVILLDLIMPLLDGLTLLRHLRATAALADVPIIVLSSEEVPELKSQAFELGANDYLVKFPSRIELVARVRAHAKAFLHERQRDAAYAALEAANRRLAEALGRVRQEEEKSERLLLNILPKPIADRLKEGETIIADHFPEVTVLFADVVGFTALSRHLTPAELVRLLNEIFSRLDGLATELGLEKIKTIGDAYMAVASLPMQRENHPEAAAEFALRAQEEIGRFNREAGTRIQFRIGINSGPVVAGVIGRNKFSYDLWGDTVNLASRMESHSQPGAIQVTEATYAELKDKYRFVPRGTIEVKGAGPMTAYWLTGRLDAARP